VSVPKPTGQEALFDAVDDLSPDDAWGVGTSFGCGAGATAADETLIEHWDGKTWTALPTPTPAGSGQCCLRTLAMGSSQG
jgi:hypothetical protein